MVVFFRQSRVLISRYLKVFFNDKQNLFLTIAIPLLTILLVCAVASEDMFAVKADNEINDGYPILSWESVDYECAKDESDDKSDDEENEDTDDEENNEKVWDGKIPTSPQLMPADSDGNEYYISSPGDLQFIANAKGEWLNKSYYLNNDIDMDGKEIVSIGTADEPFKGVFDGNGHIIRNFKIKTEEKCVGFFGAISTEDAKICHLGVEDAEISGNGHYDCVGIICGKADDDATIESCFSRKCNIDVEAEYVGGIAGKIVGEESALINCYSRADISADEGKVGGITGSAEDGKIKYTYFSGSLNVGGNSKENVGSIAGTIDGEPELVKNVYDNELITEFDAIGSNNSTKKDNIDENAVEGWKTEKLSQNATLIKSLESETDEDEVNGDFKNDGELADFGGTQTGLFMLSCVAIFVGICNSIQEICKERNILKREYMTNLKLSSYMISKLVVQGLVCAVQMIVVLVIFYVSVSDKVYPKSGVIFSDSKIESFVTMFLLAYAADAIALLISSIVKNSSTANTFIPIILIVQIIFSGVLFDLGGFMNKLAGIMISKWGIGALAATNRLNESRMSMLMENPSFSLQLGDSMDRTKDLYSATAENLIELWLILLAFVIVSSVISGLLLTRVKKDKR